MAYDGIFLDSIKEELKSTILYGRVDKIYQPERDEVILNIRSEKTSYKLLISASASYPRVQLTNINKVNPQIAPMFCMVLRKHLTSSKIINIRQLDTDRVLFIDFESLDELGYNSVYTLIIEIMGRHSNITLIRSRDNIIMDSIKHVTPEINSIRCLYPGIAYVYPPKSEKLNPFSFTLEELKKRIFENSLSIDKNIFSSLFTGVSTSLSKEMFLRINENSEICIENLNDFCITFFSDMQNNVFDFAYYIEKNKIRDFSCVNMTSWSNLTKISGNSPSELLEEFYTQKDKHDRLNYKSSDLQKLINTNLDRCNKKLTILNTTLKEASDLDKYKLYGELLTANLYNIEESSKEIEVLNYYTDTNEKIKIKLDVTKTPSQNCQLYFKKYNKFKTALKSAEEQIIIANNEVDYLQSVLTNIKNSDDYESIDEIKKELIQTGYVKFKKGNEQKKGKPSKALHFISTDGIDIYVGKNNIQNDYLTLKFADKHDTWLHTKNIPGAHVIIKKYGEIPESTIIEAAKLSAFYSKAKDSTKVPVDYTEVKNVHKPNGAKPGMVIYYTNKTLYVTADKPAIKELNS